MRQADRAARANIRKTYKLFIGGKYPRTESGRSYEVVSPSGEFIANACLASRKDVRDAVVAARGAQPAWAAATAYNRGQVLYRMGEMLDGRLDEFAGELRLATGVSAHDAEEEAKAAADRLVHYAGWTDKYGAIISTVNPVAAQSHNFTVPEPTGVVGVFCPGDRPLLSLVSLLAPVIASGNSAVVVLAERAPTPGLLFAEALGTSDLPGGVVNLLSGKQSELMAPLAAHHDVDALDLSGLGADLRTEAERLAADSVKRVAANREWDSEGLERIEPFVEYKTTWHSRGW